MFRWTYHISIQSLIIKNVFFFMKHYVFRLQRRLCLVRRRHYNSKTNIDIKPKISWRIFFEYMLMSFGCVCYWFNCIIQKSRLYKQGQEITSASDSNLVLEWKEMCLLPVTIFILNILILVFIWVIFKYILNNFALNYNLPSYDYYDSSFRNKNILTLKEYKIFLLTERFYFDGFWHVRISNNGEE